MGTDVLIELDTGVAAPVSEQPPPAHRYRTIGLALSGLLVLTLAGAVPNLAPLWRRAGVAPTAGADTTFAVRGNRLYVAAADGGTRTVTAWALRPFGRLWAASMPAADGDLLQFHAVPGRLLVRVLRREGGPFTTAFDERTGAPAWTLPQDVEPLPGGHTGLLQEQVFNTAARYDESSGAAGPLWFAQTGEAYWQPPDRSLLHGIDLADGRTRWSAQWRGAIFAAPGPASPGGVVVVSAQRAAGTPPTAPVVTQRLELLDADTGKLHRRRAVEAVDTRRVEGNPVNAQLADGLVVLDRADGTGSVRTAYGLTDLQQRWRLPYRDVEGRSRFCAGRPCVETPFGLWVLDPVTGAVRWKAPASTDLTARGGHAVQLDTATPTATPLRTVDLDTGAPRTDLTAWPITVAGEPETPLVLAAPDDRGGTAFALLPSGGRYVRPLGHARTLLADCHADARVVACRGTSGVEIFEYRS